MQANVFIIVSYFGFESTHAWTDVTTNQEGKEKEGVSYLVSICSAQSPFLTSLNIATLEGRLTLPKIQNR